MGNEFEEEKSSKSNGVVSNTRIEREFLPPPPPPPPRKNYMDSKEKQGPIVVASAEEDIFLGEGTDYEVPGKETSQSPNYEDMEESPRNKDKVSYFSEPAFGPALPSGPPQNWEDVVNYRSSFLTLA